MAISEIQLATWAKQGQTAQFTSTYDNIKTVLGHDNSPYSLKNFGIFLQGSYKNDTNIYGDSDLDIIINLKDIFIMICHSFRILTKNCFYQTSKERNIL